MSTQIQESAAKHTPGPWAWQRFLMSDEGVEQTRRLLGRDPPPAVNNEGQRYVMAGSARSNDYKRVALVDCHVEYKRGRGNDAVCAERDANASLIAAAPDLLEALCALLPMVEEWHAEFPRDIGDKEPSAIEAARAAIAKAVQS